MEIISVKNIEEYESYLKRNSGSLLQSFGWGDFQKELGRKSFRFVIKGKSEILGCFQLIKFKLPLGKSYLYCPRGVVVGKIDKNIIGLIIDEVCKASEKENSIFFRMDPEWEDNRDNRKMLKESGFVKYKKEIQPKGTLVLNISKSEDDILSQMHQKARYNIRLAGRKGVSIKASDGTDRYFEDFWRLMKKTTERDGFKSHPRGYYKKQLDFFGKKGIVKLFSAEYEGKIIAAIIVSFYARNAVYLHGASDYEYRKIMAPHLLQWGAIKEAKKRGCLTYDFWGIKIEGNKDADDWAGITRFKKSFARKFGKEVNYIGAWDYPVSKMWYQLYKTFKK